MAAVEIVRPATEIDWRCAQLLIHELIEWDVAQSRSLGFDRSGADGPAGCAAFHRWNARVCELYSVYVRPM
jgi:hypothetical protein